MKQEKTNLNNGKSKTPDRKMLTMFLIMFPSILLAGNYGSLIVNVSIKAALIFYQFVLLKSFLESYYRLVE